jgi:hypothetical protein
VKVGIVGSLNFTDRGLMLRAIEDMPRYPDRIVSGGAIGADSLAAELAAGADIPLTIHLPDRERYGWPAAAFKRNSLIVRGSDVLMAFFGPGEPPSVNKSGTMDTVRKAMKKRIPVHLYFQSDDAAR